MVQRGDPFVQSLSMRHFLSTSFKRGLTVGHTCSMKETKHMVAVAEYPAEPAATYGLTYVCKDIEHTSVGFAHACPNTALNKSSQ